MARRHLAPPEAQILTMPNLKAGPTIPAPRRLRQTRKLLGSNHLQFGCSSVPEGASPRSRLSRVVCRAGDCQVDQLGKRPRADLLHRGRTMGLDGPLADAKDVGDLLVWIAFDDHPHDLALARGQAGD